MNKAFGKAMLCMAMGLLCWMVAAGATLTQSRLWAEDALQYRAQANTQQDFASMEILRREIALQDPRALVAAWSQDLSQSAEVEETEGVCRVDVLYVDGEASLIWNLVMRHGEPLREGAEGCVLDADTAMSLFGSLDILGKWVTIGGQRLQVTGVAALLKSVAAFGSNPGRGLALVPARYAKAGTVVQAMAFASPGKTGADLIEPAQSWLGSAGMDASGTFDDGAEERILGKLFTALPAFLLILWIWKEIFLRFRQATREGIRAVRRGWNAGRREDGQVLPAVGRALWPLALLGGIALLTLLLPVPQLKAPPFLLPARWSDFSFWPALLKGWGETLAQGQMTSALRPDVNQSSLGSLCLWFSVASVMFYFQGLRAFAHKAEMSAARKAVAAGVFLCVLPPMGAWAVQQFGLLPEYHLAFTLLPLCGCLMTLGLRSAAFPHRTYGTILTISQKEGGAAKGKAPSNEALLMGETIDAFVSEPKIDQTMS